MLSNRIIPVLLLSSGKLVKTQRFSDPKYVGDPINAIRIFNDKEVDEVIVIDIDASKNNKEPDYDLIEQLAGECFMPLTYGGGISRALRQENYLTWVSKKYPYKQLHFNDYLSYLSWSINSVAKVLLSLLMSRIIGWANLLYTMLPKVKKLGHIGLIS